LAVGRFGDVGLDGDAADALAAQLRHRRLRLVGVDVHHRHCRAGLAQGMRECAPYALGRARNQRDFADQLQPLGQHVAAEPRHDVVAAGGFPASNKCANGLREWSPPHAQPMDVQLMILDTEQMMLIG